MPLVFVGRQAFAPRDDAYAGPGDTQTGALEARSSLHIFVPSR